MVSDTLNYKHPPSSSSARLSDIDNNIDVSVVLNVHNEARFIKRTLMSLHEAVLHALYHGIKTEYCIVLDCSDEDTTRAIEDYEFETARVRIRKVSHGSLGPSRNEGIAMAQGKYIMTADADDLVSFNTIHKFYYFAELSSTDCVFFPEYLLGFGDKNFVWKYYSIDYVGPAVFFERHPYVSRLFASRELLKDLKYEDASISSKYAYEDWHFNCQLLAKSVRFEIAVGTILFYRQRSGSLLHLSKLNSKTIPPSSLFHPAKFARAAWSQIYEKAPLLMPPKLFAAEDFCDAPGSADLLAAANCIDPAISLGIVRSGLFGSNLGAAGSKTITYFDLCRAIGANNFTDVILISGQTKTYSQAYILSILEVLSSIDQNANFLFLTEVEFIHRSTWEKKIPGSIFVDLSKLSVPEPSNDVLDYVMPRLLQHIEGMRRVHIEGCAFGRNFIKKSSSIVDFAQLYFYYTEDNVCREHGYEFHNGYNFDIVSEYGHTLTRIIIESHIAFCRVAEMMGNNSNKNLCALSVPPDTIQRRPETYAPHYHLLWITDYEEPERLDFLMNVSARLRRRLQEVRIDVVTTVTHTAPSSDMLKGALNVQYLRECCGLSPTDATIYDAILYTSRFGDLPIEISEAMGVKLPVIWQIGGVIGATENIGAYLDKSIINMENLAGDFIGLIEKFYVSMRSGLSHARTEQTSIDEQTSVEKFRRHISNIFFPTQGGSG